MKRQINIILLVIVGICVHLVISSYDNATMHPSMNEAAYDAFIESIKKDQDFENYNFSATQKMPGMAVVNYKPLTDWAYRQIRIPEGEKSYNIKQWLQHGAYSADIPEALQALRHFYDPIGIDGGAHHLTDENFMIWLVEYSSKITNPEIDIISWALEYESQINKGLTGIIGMKQNYSWMDGQRSIIKAVSMPHSREQDILMAHAWRSLGESLHALGDMVCPVHVRNDGHPYSDPYEDAIRGSKFIPENPSSYWNNPLINQIKNTKDIDNIYKLVALYTNENFFTTQTINGYGYKRMLPELRADNPYPKPYAAESGEGWDYESSDFIFYNRINGHDIKMCKDLYFFSPSTGFRTDEPYIDLEVAKDQSKILLSNFLGVAPEVIKRYIPKISIKLESINESDKKIEGTVSMSFDSGINRKIFYESTVYLSNHSTIKEVKIETGSDGRFLSYGLDLSEGDAIRAKIILGGMVVYSDMVRVTKGELNTEGIDGIVSIDEPEYVWELLEIKDIDGQTRVASVNKNNKSYHTELNYSRGSISITTTFIGRTDNWYSPPQVNGESASYQFTYGSPPSTLMPEEELSIPVTLAQTANTLSFFGFSAGAWANFRRIGSDGDPYPAESFVKQDGKTNIVCSSATNFRPVEDTFTGTMPNIRKEGQLLEIAIGLSNQEAKTKYIYQSRRYEPNLN